MRARTFLVILAIVAAAGVVAAHELDTDKGEETVRPLMMQKVPPHTGEMVHLALVSYEPGQRSKPHEHPGAIFAYVIEGAVISQLEGEPVKTYTKGQSWYEPPLAHHLVSRNASEQSPATLLVFSLARDFDPIKRPLSDRP